MTTTTINRAAALRALADHIEGCELDASSITSIQFEDSFTWPGLLLHVLTAEAFAAWVRSPLGEVESRAFWHGGSVHVRVTGTITSAAADLPVRLLYIATPNDRDVVAAFRGSLDATSGRGGGELVAIPAALGGAA